MRQQMTSFYPSPNSFNNTIGQDSDVPKIFRALHQLNDKEKETLLTGIGLVCCDVASKRHEPLAAEQRQYAGRLMGKCLHLCTSKHLYLKDYFWSYVKTSLCQRSAQMKMPRLIGYQAIAELLKDSKGQPRPEMNLLRHIYDFLRHIPDINAGSLKEKVKLHDLFSKLPIEDVLYSPRVNLEQAKKGFTQTISPQEYFTLLGHKPDLDDSEFFLLTYSLLQHLAAAKPGTNVISLNQQQQAAQLASELGKAYMALDYNKCFNLIDKKLYGQNSIFKYTPFHYVCNVIKPYVDRPEPERNYSRRYFEENLSQRILHELLVNQWKSTQCLIQKISDTTVHMKIDTLEDAIFALSNLTHTLSHKPWTDATPEDKQDCKKFLVDEWLWPHKADGSRDEENLNLLQQASLRRLQDPVFATRGLIYKDGVKHKAQIAREADYGSMFYSRQLGPIKANQPMPFDRHAPCNILNKQTDIVDYWKDRPAYPPAHKVIPFVSSISGHSVWQSFALLDHLQEAFKTSSPEHIQKDISKLFLMTAAMFNLEGYHSLFEVFNVLELNAIKPVFERFGISPKPVSLVNEPELKSALLASADYALSLVQRRCLHRQIESQALSHNNA